MQLRKLAKRWNLIWCLSKHDFYLQYTDSRLGMLWAMIKPFILVACYSIVFSSMIPQADAAEGKAFNFGIILFAGMLPWFAIQDALQRGTSVYLDYHALVRNHNLPLYIYPLFITLSATASELVAILVFLILKLLVYHSFSWHVFFLIPMLPIQIIFCMGILLTTSVFSVFSRDTVHFTTAFLYIWLFSSPIIFPLESMPAHIQSWIWFNPLTSLTEYYRAVILYNQIPSLKSCMFFSFFAVLFIIIGCYVFKRAETEIVDRV